MQYQELELKDRSGVSGDIFWSEGVILGEGAYFGDCGPILEPPD